MKNVIVFIFFFLSLTYSQNGLVDKVGFGYAISPWLSIAPNNTVKNNNGITILFPGTFKNHYFFEPEVAYFYYENDFPDTSSGIISNSGFRVLFGTFFKYNVDNKTNMYFGARTGILGENIEYIDTDLIPFSETVDYLVFAPTLGFEYNITEKFSIGFESNYVGLSSENKENINNPRNTANFITSRLSVRYFPIIK